MNNFLKPYIARPPKQYELMTDAELSAGRQGFLIVDCELYPNYFLVCMKHRATKKIIKFEIREDNREKFNTDKLEWVLRNYWTVGFNSIKFDMPLLWYSCNLMHLPSLEQIKEVCDAIIYRNVFPKQLEQDFNFTITKTNHIDLIEVCPLRGSLKLYGARLHAPRIQDLPFDVSAPLDKDQFDIVVDYCINDLDTTEILFDNLSEQLKLRFELTKEYRQDLMSKSDAQIAETVISSELKRITGKWPSKPKIDQLYFHYRVPDFISFQTEALKQVLEKVKSVKYGFEEGYVKPQTKEEISVNIGHSVYRLGSGGLHSSEKCTAIKATNDYRIFDRDVASYYPAIVLNCKLFPIHIGKAFLQVYKTIVDRRITAKRAKDIAVSECLKITINGTFGKTGSPYSVLFAPQMMIQITVTGQLALLMLIERLELASIPVASANTDGVLIYCPRSLENDYRRIIKEWEQVTSFETEETEYESIFARDVNAYIAVKKGRKEVKAKNLYYDPWRGKTAKDGYWRFQKNPSTQICVEAIERLLLADVPIEQTIKQSRDFTKFVAVKNVTGGAHKDREYLGKVIRWYYAKKVFGTINYISSGNKVPDTDGAKPCMDLPDHFPDDIDYDRYIYKTIEMMYDIAYLEPSEKQLELF